MEIKEAADIYRACDRCFRGMRVEDYRATGRERKVMGLDEMTPEIVCPACFDLFRRVKDGN